jgi:hypothetical protein
VVAPHHEWDCSSAYTVLDWLHVAEQKVNLPLLRVEDILTVFIPAALVPFFAVNGCQKFVLACPSRPLARVGESESTSGFKFDIQY